MNPFNLYAQDIVLFAWYWGININIYLSTCARIKLFAIYICLAKETTLISLPVYLGIMFIVLAILGVFKAWKLCNNYVFESKNDIFGLHYHMYIT